MGERERRLLCRALLPDTAVRHSRDRRLPAPTWAPAPGEILGMGEQQLGALRRSCTACGRGSPGAAPVLWCSVPPVTGPLASVMAAALCCATQLIFGFPPPNAGAQSPSHMS